MPGGKSHAVSSTRRTFTAADPKTGVSAPKLSESPPVPQSPRLAVALLQKHHPLRLTDLACPQMREVDAAGDRTPVLIDPIPGYTVAAGGL